MKEKDKGYNLKQDKMANASEVDVQGNLSPSCITDFFKSKKSPIKGTAAKKISSSVYLTPESSPIKDQSNTDDVVSNGLAAKAIESQASELSQNGSIHNPALVSEQKDLNKLTINTNSFLENGTCDSREITNDLAESMENAQETNVDRHAVDDTTSVDTFEKPVLSHSPCSSSYATSSKPDTKIDNPSLNMSSESSAVSSPLLPRSKVRKGLQLKKAPGAADNAVTVSHVTDSSQMKPKPGRRKKKEPAPVQTSTITDFFPVRRSGRQTKREIQKQRSELVETLITSNCEDGLEVKHFEGKGRGVVATKAFDKGDFVIEYAGDLINVAAAREREQKYLEIPEVGCYMYYFIHGGKHYCVDATSESGRLGRLINHSRDGNCCTKVVSLKEGPRLILVAARDIKVGEELSYDYGDRRKSSIDAHPWLKL